MRKAASIFIAACAFYSCKKDSDDVRTSDNADTKFYGEIVETLLKNPSDRIVEVTLPNYDNRNSGLEVADLKTKKIEVVRILEEKGFKIIDSTFRHDSQAFGTYSKCYVLEKDDYQFTIWRDYEGTKLYQVYRISDRMGYNRKKPLFHRPTRVLQQGNRKL